MSVQLQGAGSQWEGDWAKLKTLCQVYLSVALWVDLHKESRRLENEVDLKLLSFSKLGSNYTQRDSTADGHGANVGGSGHVFDTMALEISELLSKVST